MRASHSLLADVTHWHADHITNINRSDGRVRFFFETRRSSRIYKEGDDADRRLLLYFLPFFLWGQNETQRKHQRMVLYIRNTQRHPSKLILHARHAHHTDIAIDFFKVSNHIYIYIYIPLLLMMFLFFFFPLHLYLLRLGIVRLSEIEFTIIMLYILFFGWRLKLWKQGMTNEREQEQIKEIKITCLREYIYTYIWIYIQQKPKYVVGYNNSNRIMTNTKEIYVHCSFGSFSYFLSGFCFVFFLFVVAT